MTSNSRVEAIDHAATVGSLSASALRSAPPPPHEARARVGTETAAAPRRLRRAGVNVIGLLSTVKRASGCGPVTLGGLADHAPLSGRGGRLPHGGSAQRQA